MSINYTYNPNWINRDSQPDGSALRVVKASDFEAEWVSIQNSFTEAAPAASPVLTGTVDVQGSVTATGTVAATGAVTGSNINATNWDTAFGWGDHGTEGYLVATGASYNNSNWEAAFGWCNHASVGYALASNVPTNSGYNNSNWDTAFSWGNHASAGYALASNVPTKTGSGASGTWGINISGNASSATTATTATSATSATSAATATNALACSGNSATATSATTATNCSRSISAGTNLSGGGALTANQTLSLVAEPSLTSVVLGNWKIFDSSNILYFQYSGNNVFRIDTAGNMITEGDVTAKGSV